MFLFTISLFENQSKTTFCDVQNFTQYLSNFHKPSHCGRLPDNLIFIPIAQCKNDIAIPKVRIDEKQGGRSEESLRCSGHEQSRGKLRQ